MRKVITGSLALSVAVASIVAASPAHSSAIGFERTRPTVQFAEPPETTKRPVLQVALAEPPETTKRPVLQFAEPPETTKRPVLQVVA